MNVVCIYHGMWLSLWKSERITGFLLSWNVTQFMKIWKNYWGFGLCPSSGILKTRKHNISETGSFSVLRWRGEDTYSVGSLEKNLSKGPNWVGVFPPSPENGNRSNFRNVVLSSFSNTGRWTKLKPPVILSVIHHRQNPLEYTRFGRFLFFSIHTRRKCSHSLGQ
jgi:hypothetical protein